MEVVMEENKMHTGELYRSNDKQKQIIKLTKQDLFKMHFLVLLSRMRKSMMQVSNLI